MLLWWRLSLRRGRGKPEGMDVRWLKERSRDSRELEYNNKTGSYKTLEKCDNIRYLLLHYILQLPPKGYYFFRITFVVFQFSSGGYSKEKTSIVYIFQSFIKKKT